MFLLNVGQDGVFDPDLLRQAYDQVISRVEPVAAARTGDTVTSISLTHRPGAVSPLTDGNESQFGLEGIMRYSESDFSEFNSMFDDTYFAQVYRDLPFQVGRMRLILVKPLQVYRMHKYASQRAHLAIHTNADAFLVGPDGCGTHIPADGRLRVFDTRMRHTVFNAGNEIRVHLVMALAGTEPEQLISGSIEGHRR